VRKTLQNWKKKHDFEKHCRTGRKNTISSGEKINSFVHSPKLVLMIGPRTDTQFTGGNAT